MPEKKILLIDSDPALKDVLKFKLESMGYSFIGTDDITKGLALYKQEKPHLIILDLGYPSVECFSFCKQIKSDSNTAILTFTIQKNIQKLEEMYESGIDDYLLKPFQLKELIFKIKSLLRRSNLILSPELQALNNLNQSEILHAGDITLIPESREAKFRGSIVHFTPIEFEILHCLMQNLGKTVAPNQLIAEIWGNSTQDDIETIRVHIRHLRQRLEETLYNDPNNVIKRKYIRTIYGKGYQLIAEGFVDD